VYVYLHSALADYLSIKLWFSTDATFAKDISMSREITATSHKNGWNCFDFYRSQYTTDGTQLANTDTITRMKIQVNSRTTNIVEASFDQILSNVQGVPAVMISLDDGRSSVYTEAFAYMKTKKAKGTAFVISGNVDTATYITSAQIQEMNAAGWLMGNHSNDGTVLTSLSQANAQANLVTCKNFLSALGCTRGIYHVAYPGGNSSETVRAALAAESMLSGRMNWVDTFPAVSEDLWYTYGCNFPAYNTSLATVKALVDSAVSDKRVCGLGFHELVSSPAATQWKISDFQALIDYIKTLGIPFLGIDDLYSARTGPITVPL
jgi:peptidoglycan/xylan/chitin deacetylase (PgdA/CDA1 family)